MLTLGQLPAWSHPVPCPPWPPCPGVQRSSGKGGHQPWPLWASVSSPTKQLYEGQSDGPRMGTQEHAVKAEAFSESGRPKSWDSAVKDEARAGGPGRSESEWLVMAALLSQSLTVSTPVWQTGARGPRPQARPPPS